VTSFLNIIRDKIRTKVENIHPSGFGHTFCDDVDTTPLGELGMDEVAGKHRIPEASEVQQPAKQQRASILAKRRTFSLMMPPPSAAAARSGGRLSSFSRTL
jgi:hypothetical protein